MISSYFAVCLETPQGAHFISSSSRKFRSKEDAVETYVSMFTQPHREDTKFVAYAKDLSGGSWECIYESHEGLEASHYNQAMSK